MQLSKTRKCEQCKIDTPLDNLKLFPSDDGKNYVFLCSECATLFKKRTKPKEEAAVRSSSAKGVSGVVAPKSAAQPQKSAIKEALVCLRCNYKFKADLDKAGVSYNLVCPYCGRKDQIRTYNSPLL